MAWPQFVHQSLHVAGRQALTGHVNDVCALLTDNLLVHHFHILALEDRTSNTTTTL